MRITFEVVTNGMNGLANYSRNVLGSEQLAR